MGRAPCCDKTSVKRGPWSPEEDSKLKEYIHKNGTGGNWIALPQKAGLKRCGKSCRLRWLNYLRPNIKHGDFSDEEDRIICSLYVNIGSRWSIIAAQLPGRTDNDIKNYWNTKLKKKLMGLLPLTNQIKKPNFPSSSSPQHNHLPPSASSHTLSSSIMHCSYGPTTLSFTGLEPIIPSPITTSLSLPFYYQESNDNNMVSTVTPMEQYYNYPAVIFGSEGSSCSSSDGSCTQVKQEEIGHHQSYNSNNNNNNNNQNFVFGGGENTVDLYGEKSTLTTPCLDCDIEDIKQLINSSGSSFSSFDENKTGEKGMFCYYY